MPESASQENFLLPEKKSWYKTGKGLSLVAFLSLLVIVFLIFVGFFSYYAWQIKYGDAGKLAKQFGNDKFSMDSRLANSANNQKVLISDWQKYLRSTDPVWGEPSASITILAFIDFECPYSREAYAGFKTVMEKYGPVIKVIFKSLPLASIHPNSSAAANAAACAKAQDKFWPYYDRLFTTQLLDKDSLLASAEALGLDKNSFKSCLEQEAHQGALNNDLLDAANMGVRGTPTYFVNGLKVEGVTSAADWDKIILGFLK